MSPTTASRRSRSIDPIALILPAMALLAGTCIVPIVWFLVKVAVGYDGSLGALARSAFLSPDIIYILWVTIAASLLITVITLVLAYPLAYMMARSTQLVSTLIIVCVILPYFTSVIVRTYAFMVLLGSHGIVNETLLKLGWISEPLALMYNKGGVIVAMTYVLLPYLTLTLMVAMKGIDMNLVRAAHSLGASGWYTFSRIFFPLSLHGVVSGSLIVFILTVGSFVTPALMGGPSDVMLAMLIQHEAEITLNWPLAAMLSMVLLAATVALYWVYCRFTDLDKMMA